MNCDTARIYCGAVADGEVAIVPAAVLEHIHACHDCSTEVRWQREAEDALEGALAEAEPPQVLRLQEVASPARWWRRGGAFATIAAAAAILLVAGVVALGHRGAVTPPPGAEAALGQAAHAYGTPATFNSNDAAAISGWSAGRGMQVEVMAVPDAVPTGGRVSTIAGHPVVTVIYAGPRGTTEVTMVPSAMTGGWPTMEAMNMNHHPVGLVRHGAIGVILVTPDDGSLHAAMTALQAA